MTIPVLISVISDGDFGRYYLSCFKKPNIMINKTNRHDHRVDYSIKIRLYSVNKNI